MKRGLRLVTLGVFAVIALVLVGRSMVIVDETEYVLITSFGRPAALLGDDPGETGLAWTWPWRGTRRVDRRLRFFEPPTREVMTRDKTNLDVAALVAWQVEDPIAFIQAAGSTEAVETRLEERIASALSNAIGRRELASLATTDPETWSLDTLTEEVIEAVAPGCREELGVVVRDLRLRRFQYPTEVRPAVFDLIRSERQQVADRLRAEGEALYRTITSQAERDRDAILAEADAEAERIRASAEATAIRVLNDAQAIDPEFAALLQALDAYKAVLDAQATVILSPESPWIDLFQAGPGSPPQASSAPSLARDPDASRGLGSEEGP